MAADLNADVRGIIERPIADLVAIGLTGGRPAALRMLAFQYIIRLSLADDTQGLMELRQEIDAALADERDDAGGLQ